MDTQVRPCQYQPARQAMLNTVQLPEHALYASERRISRRNLKDSLKWTYEWLQTSSAKLGGCEGEGQRCFISKLIQGR